MVVRTSKLASWKTSTLPKKVRPHRRRDRGPVRVLGHELDQSLRQEAPRPPRMFEQTPPEGAVAPAPVQPRGAAAPTMPSPAIRARLRTPAPEQPSIFQRWWFWTAVGGRGRRHRGHHRGFKPWSRAASDGSWQPKVFQPEISPRLRAGAPAAPPACSDDSYAVVSRAHLFRQCRWT